ncbi:C25 family cysteine peptidase [Aeoliella sp. ICT_H6.2]|uniref:C25 family cysteine peptidase n=1 Tax=Aeoliella straminimaris TaxID=2954799 RepID=A0A9X2JHR1_9BACT|nr:C25 family cysteine peptidase [Aeoliella straminimaris]MCO6045717.1 C25 family cysteine peptidase [Aeoliella straminimaris]
MTLRLPKEHHVALWIAAVLIAAATATTAQAKLWLAVTTAELAPGVKTLAEHRRKDGLKVEVFVGQPQAALEKYPTPDYLLLVGDVAGEGERPDPVWQVDARVCSLYRWVSRQPDEFYSDSMWGDRNGDGMPEVPVGRLPARTLAELDVMTRKIIAYEERPWTTDDLRFPTWVGHPMATPMFNRMATGLVVSQIGSRLPGWSEFSMISGDPDSAFCGWAADQPHTFHQWLARGGLLATVGAHGTEYSWLSVLDDNRATYYDVRQQAESLQQGGPTCPLVLFTCLSGKFTAPQRCVSESMVLAPGGPVAAVGATTESHPLPNTLTACGLQQTVASQHERLGDLWLESQLIGYKIRDFMLETLLKDLEGSLEQPIDTDKLRRDQLRMYALMGDPATRIRLPRELNAKLAKTDDGWQWKVERPEAATRLHVHFRPAGAQMPTRPPGIDQHQAKRLLGEANQMFAYERRGTLTADEEWTGSVNQPGEIRLVAQTPDAWYAAVLKVEESSGAGE